MTPESSTEPRRPSLRRARLHDLRHLLLFALGRLVALLATVLVGVYLTIVVANMGGQVDELRLVQIRSEVVETVRADPAFFDLSLIHI